MGAQLAFRSDLGDVGRDLTTGNLVASKVAVISTP
jgi:hypothetical protein